MMKTNFHMVDQPRTKENDVIWTFLTDMTVKIPMLVPNKLQLVSVNGLSDIHQHVLASEIINIKFNE